MAKPILKKKIKKAPTDINVLMHSLGKRSTEPAAPESPAPEVTPEDIRRVMSALGSRGGKKGGKRRMETMTDKERSDVAYKAARARWDKAPKKG